MVYLSAVGEHVVTLVVPLLLKEFSLRVLSLHDAYGCLWHSLRTVVGALLLLCTGIDGILSIVYLITLEEVAEQQVYVPFHKTLAR